VKSGGLFRQPTPSKLSAQASPGDAGPPAGFWRRSAAYGTDWLLLAPCVALVLRSPLATAWAGMRDLNALLQDWLLDRLLEGSGPMPSPLALARTLMEDAPLLASVEAQIVHLSLAVTQAAVFAAGTAGLYFIGFEASAWQATPGKRWLGLKVVDLRGAPIGWGRASARFLAGTLSWLTLNLGHALAGWRADGRALHDLIAGTRVVTRSPVRQRSGDRSE
jgi:uncharacterized RDD family membrane protein YckC